MSTIQGIPPSRTAIVDVGGTASRPWYLFFQNVSTTLTSQQAQIDALVVAGGGSSGGLPSTSNVIGQNSILSQGVLANGIVTISLAGDVSAPGNTYYYGTNGTGVKSFYSVASAFLGTTDNIALNVGSNGVTTVSIASTYPGQTSITTLGTITTGIWHGTTIDAAHGGTGHASYAVGDLLYADTSSSLARVAATTNGYVLTLVSGIPAWEPAASGGVTSITAGTGLSASPSNPITTSGTLSLSPRGASTLMGNPTASSAVPSDITIGSGLALSLAGVLSATGTSGIPDAPVDGNTYARLNAAWSALQLVTGLGANGLTLGDYLLQWGTGTAPASGLPQTDSLVTFPVTFATAYWAFAVPLGKSQPGGPVVSYPTSAPALASFTAEFDIAEGSTGGANFTNPCPFFWVAFGRLTGTVSTTTFIAATPVTYSTVTSQSVMVPTLATTGDLIVAHIMHRDVLTPPAGWTLSDTVNANAGTLQYQSCYTRVALASDPGTSFTWTQASSQRMAVHYQVFRKAGGCSVLQTAHQGLTTTGTTMPWVGITAASPGIFVAASSQTQANVAPTVTIISSSQGTLTTPASVADNRMGVSYQSAAIGQVFTGNFTSSASPGSGITCLSINMIIG